VTSQVTAIRPNTVKLVAVPQVSQADDADDRR
jgi:hypothetical protein